MQKLGVYMLFFPFCGLGREARQGGVVCLIFFIKPTGEYSSLFFTARKDAV